MVKELKAALQRTQLQLGLLWQAKLKNDKLAFGRLLNVEADAIEEEGEGLQDDDVDDLTPPLPILQMGLDQLTSYFAKLMKRLLQMQGGHGRLWAGTGKPAGKKTTNIVVHLQFSSTINYTCQLQAKSTFTTRLLSPSFPEMATTAGGPGARA